VRISPLLRSKSLSICDSLPNCSIKRVLYSSLGLTQLNDGIQIFTVVSKGAVFPHHWGIETFGRIIAKNITMVDRMRPESSPAAVI
jgi:hypothetical protein